MIATQLEPMQGMVACIAQWRDSIVSRDDAGLQDQVRDIESASRMLHSVMLDTVAELDSRNVAATAGFGTTKRLLAAMLQLSATEAGTRVTHATQLGARRALTGEALAPALPNTAAALAAGQIGPAQVRVITETMAAIPASVSVAQQEAVEAELARHARSFTPTSLHKIGRHILAHVDPDGPAPHDDQEPAAAAGELRFRERRDGRLGFEGFLESEHSAAFRSLIEQFAKPRPAAEGIPDARTAPQRNADALLEVCGLARSAQDCPTTAGEPPHLTVTIDWDALRTGLGAATWTTGHTSAPPTPGGGHATRKSSRSSWAATPSHSTLGGPCGPSRWLSVEHWSRGTADVRFRVAIDHQECAKPTIADTGSTMVKAAWRTASCSVRHITATYIAPVGKSSSATAMSTSSHLQSSTRPAHRSTIPSAAENDQKVRSRAVPPVGSERRK